MRNSCMYVLLIPLLLTICLAESYSALTAFGQPNTDKQNTDKHGSHNKKRRRAEETGFQHRTRECKSNEDCAAIQNTSCLSDPRDYKMKCLCRDSSAPINGACPNRPKAVGLPCQMDSECIDGSECKSMNMSIAAYKTCQCKAGLMSKDGYCSNAFSIPVPHFFTLIAIVMAHLTVNKLSILF